MRWSLVLSLGLLVSGLSHAATYRVPPGGSIQAGIAHLAPGDTLEVSGGTYAECLRDVGAAAIPAGRSWDAPTTIKAAPGQTVWLRRDTQCEGGVSLIDFGQNRAQYIVFEGINLNGVNSSYNCIMVGAMSHLRFQDMEVKHCSVGIQGGVNHSTFLRVHAHHNGYNEQGVHTCPQAHLGCHGFYLPGAHNTLLQVQASHNSGIGITLSCEGCGGQVHDNRITASVIRDNAGYGVMLYGGNMLEDTRICRNIVGIVSYPATLRQNQVVGNREAGLVLHGSGHSLEGNVVRGNGGEPADAAAGDVCAGPSALPPTPPVVRLPAPRNLRIISVK